MITSPWESGFSSNKSTSGSRSDSDAGKSWHSAASLSCASTTCRVGRGISAHGVRPSTSPGLYGACCLLPSLRFHGGWSSRRLRPDQARSGVGIQTSCNSGRNARKSAPGSHSAVEASAALIAYGAVLQDVRPSRRQRVLFKIEREARGARERQPLGVWRRNAPTAVDDIHSCLFLANRNDGVLGGREWPLSEAQRKHFRSEREVPGTGKNSY
jgi:hypothetical protein